MDIYLKFHVLWWDLPGIGSAGSTVDAEHINWGAAWL